MIDCQSPINQSINHQSITNQSINHQSINHQSITNQSINQSINHQSINQSPINQSPINRSITASDWCRFYALPVPAGTGRSSLWRWCAARTWRGPGTPSCASTGPPTPSARSRFAPRDDLTIILNGLTILFFKWSFCGRVADGREMVGGDPPSDLTA